MEVQSERNATVARTFRNNLGSLEGDLLTMAWRNLVTIWLVLMARLNPLALLKRQKDGELRSRLKHGMYHSRVRFSLATFAR